MPVDWSVERVLALAPDAASAKAGQGLASAKTWASLGSGDGLIWGECQGSGKQPYQTKVDPEEPASSCSCPSRKFPCKHALGLMLIWATSRASIVEGAPPAWVAAWKEARAKKAEAKQEKAERPPAPIDEAAQAKRQAARVAKVAAGLDDLSLWLSDLVRQGFTSLGAKSRTVWGDQARRMIDAQAPGVARRLRQIDDMPFGGDGWQTALLDRLARLHLLAEGFRRRDGLSPEVAEDVRSAIGFPVDLNSVRLGPGVRDRWQVTGHAFLCEDKIVLRRTWLLGRDTQRAALLIDFAAGNKPLDVGLPPGFVIDAELAFVPGSLPLRVLVKERHAAPEPMGAMTGGTTIAAAVAAYGDALAKNPWLELFPIVLADVVLQLDGESWCLRDASGMVLPLSTRFALGWHLLALGGGGPLAMSGEFDGATLEALGCHVDGRYVPLSTSSMHPQQMTAVAMPVATPLLLEATASAVVGVDRKPPPAPPLDSPFALALSGVENQEPPSRLLAIAVASSLYGRVGRKAAICASPAPEPCPPDDRAECAVEVASRLRAMLGGQHVEVLPEWLDLLAASGRQVPHDGIVELFGEHHDRSVPIESLIEGIGVRGQWLAAKNPAWSRFTKLEAAADPVVVWETGAPHERLAALRSLREHDPARARDLIAATFASESADVRTAFLGELTRNLSIADEPFLEAALDDRSKEVRRRSADLLRRLPTSRLCLRMIERARPLLTWKRGLMGLGRGSLVVEPPIECDKAMVRDGIPPKPGTTGKSGERGTWLSAVLMATPTAAISAMLGVPPGEIVVAAQKNDWHETLRSAWIASAVAHLDIEWAEALLAASTWKPDPHAGLAVERGLFEILPATRKQAIFLTLLRSTPGGLTSEHPAASFVFALKEAMTEPVAREILMRTRQVVDDERAEFARPGRQVVEPNASGIIHDRTYHNNTTYWVIQNRAAVLPVSLANVAAEGFDPGDPPHGLYASAYALMIERLQFRRDMHREFSP